MLIRYLAQKLKAPTFFFYMGATKLKRIHENCGILTVLLGLSDCGKLWHLHTLSQN